MDIFTKTINKINKMERLKDMSQYILLMFANGVIIDADLVIISIINSMKDNKELLSKAIELLKSNTKDIDIKEYNNKIMMTSDLDEDIKTVFLKKKKKNFILKEFYLDELEGKYDSGVLYNRVFVNKNITGFLSGENNFIVIDDEVDFIGKIIEELVTDEHKYKLISITKLGEFLKDKLSECECVIDFITADIKYVLEDMKEEVYEAIKSDEYLIDNFKVMSLIANSTDANIEYVESNDMKSHGFNIGITDLFNIKR